MHFHSTARPRRFALTFVLLGASPGGFVHAQPAPAAPPARPAAAAASSPSATLAPVVITGNPLGSRDIAPPVTVLSGDELVLRRGASLGETLNGQPGVSSTYFGPNANRPIIRGLDGDRVRILNNAGGSIDASSLSFDHAVPIDPLVVERIEVLRGPAALLYGGSAIGGAVNAIDNRIPRDPLTGVSGAAEGRFGGAEGERGGAALVEAGNGRFAVHADAFGRQTSDLRVPRYTPVDGDGNVLPSTSRVRNSAARGSGGALGGSWTFGTGHLGIAADRYDSRYGVIAEEDVAIRMKRDHVALAGEARDLGGPIRTVRAQVNDTRYRHDEVEGSGAIGTTFKTSGRELRLEAEHAPIGALKGVIGGQFERIDFSALGEEAFVPSTRTRRGALFLVEELASPIGTVTGGIRVERATVSSEGDADPADARFGPAAERRFTLTSASIGDVWKFGTGWSLNAVVSSTARAPTAFELFANGVHAATGAFERGDPSLGTERGHNIDVGLQWQSGDDRLRVGAFAARFARFVALENTGRVVTVDGEDFPEYQFRAVRAQLAGFEIDGRRRVVSGAWTLDVSGKVDYTRATNRSTGEPLPRVAPLRASMGLGVGTGPWLGRLEVEHAARQERVPSYDTETAGHTLVHVALSRHFRIGGVDAYAFVKGTNLGDRLAYSATTLQTLRGLVPLAGRAWKAGLRVTF